MELVKRKTDWGTDVCLIDTDKTLKFEFGGDGDLYWTIIKKIGPNDKVKYESTMSFEITKDEYNIYKLFEKLFDDIENVTFEKTKKAKELYTKKNYARYSELCDRENHIITWYSDEEYHEITEILKITKGETFKLDFILQDISRFYSGIISIRFRNSGSRYSPFNCVFMDMYNKLIDLEQIEKEKTKVR